jgi:hypothetical protein
VGVVKHHVVIVVSDGAKHINTAAICMLRLTNKTVALLISPSQPFRTQYCFLSRYYEL